MKSIANDTSKPRALKPPADTFAKLLAERAKEALLAQKQATNRRALGSMFDAALKSKLFDAKLPLLEIMLRRAIGGTTLATWMKTPVPSKLPTNQTKALQRAKFEARERVAADLMRMLTGRPRASYANFKVNTANRKLAHDPSMVLAAEVVSVVLDAVGLGTFGLRNVGMRGRDTLLPRLTRFFTTARVRLLGEYERAVADVHRSVHAIEAQKFGKLYAGDRQGTAWIRDMFVHLDDVVDRFGTDLRPGNARQMYDQRVRALLAELVRGSGHHSSIAHAVKVVMDARETFGDLDKQHDAVARAEATFAAFAGKVKAAGYEGFLPRVHELELDLRSAPAAVAARIMPALKRMPQLERFVV